MENKWQGEKRRQHKKQREGSEMTDGMRERWIEGSWDRMVKILAPYEKKNGGLAYLTKQK